MNPATYRREGNDILASDTDPETKELREYKVAAIDDEGHLRMARGQAEAHKEAVEKFLEESGELEDEEEDGVTSAAPVDGKKPPVDRDGDPKVLPMPPPVADRVSDTFPKPASDSIPPCPPEDPSHGDKTPEVIRWWYRHHPEEARTRYEHRKWDRSILE